MADVYVHKIVFNVSSTAGLEKLMSQASEAIDKLAAIAAKGEAALVKLDKITGETSGLLETAADLTDANTALAAELAALKAAGTDLPPGLLAAIDKLSAQADATTAKVNAIDALVIDPAPAAP